MMKKTNNHSRQSPWESFDVEVTGFHRCQKNGLQGYATAHIKELGMEIRNIAVFKKNGKASIALPSIPPSAENGNRWFKIIDFYDKRDVMIFEKKILEALDAFFKENSRDSMSSDASVVLI